MGQTTAAGKRADFHSCVPMTNSSQNPGAVMLAQLMKNNETGLLWAT